ncbi:MAG: electron transfer flavoprotein subunit beta/FixA family protein [Sandaracinaceae bacterium]
MRFMVCVKQVPDLDSVDVDPITGQVDEHRLLYLTNPADEAALELALRRRDRGGGDVLAVTVGPPRADRALRQALAAGVDDVLRIDAEGGFPVRTAALLSAVAESRAPDVVLCGHRTDDRGSAEVPAYLAELLGRPLVTDVVELELGDGPGALGRIEVTRALRGGARERVEAALPAVLALTGGNARLRHATFPALAAAERAAIPVTTPAALDVAMDDNAYDRPHLRVLRAPRPRPRSIFAPDPDKGPFDRLGELLGAGVTRGSGRILEGEPEELAGEVVRFLDERGILAAIAEEEG